MRAISLKVFRDYRESHMTTSKWRDINHAVDSLTKIDSIAYLDAGCFENSKNRFKEGYRHTFEKRFSAMCETVAKNALLVSVNETQLKYMNESKKETGIETMIEYHNVLVRAGKESKICNILESSRCGFRRSIQASYKNFLQAFLPVSLMFWKGTVFDAHSTAD